MAFAPMLALWAPVVTRQCCADDWSAKLRALSHYMDEYLVADDSSKALYINMALHSDRYIILPLFLMFNINSALVLEELATYFFPSYSMLLPPLCQLKCFLVFAENTLRI